MQFDNDGRVTEQGLTHLKEAANAEANPVKYLGIDPGGTNGVCGYDGRFYLIFMYNIKAPDMTDFVEVFEHLDTIVIEDFKLYPNKAKQQFYSDMQTSRIIGGIETWARLKKVTVVKQGANIKDTGYKWIGKKPLPKINSRNHQMDAHVHFMYWAISNKKVDPGKLLEL